MRSVISQNSVEINHSRTKAEDTAADAAVVFFEENSKEIQTLTKKLGAPISTEEFSGKFGTSLHLNSHAKLKARNIIMIGLGKKEKITPEIIRRASAVAAAKSKESKYKFISLNVPSPPREVAQAAAEGFLLALYSFEKYKSKKEFAVEKITFCSSSDISKSVETAAILSEETCFVRDLVNTPASDRTPKVFADIAKEKARKYGIKCKIIGRTEARKIGLNAFLTVAQGSAQEPFFILLEWNPKAKRKIALVGKGITFDSGGLDIKPADSMLGMHGDMEGAAVVLGTIIAAARTKMPLHVIGAMPLCENMPSGSAYKPGDILRTYKGKTIEVVNTDAEGRVILADALAYVEKNYKAEAIIDLATLTGACVVALGHEAAGLLGNDAKLLEKIKAASSATDERVWELPLWEDYRDLVRSDVADVRNTGKEKGSAGTITGAAFLEAFVDKTPWAHLDIAGVTLYEKNKYYIQKGSTGWGLRLLYRLLQDWR